MTFTKATKKKAKARVALIGPSGSGKSFTGLSIARGLAAATSGRIAALDSEHGSLSKYADLFDFDAMEPADFSPATYVAAIQDAAAAGYAVVLIDSLSHAWMGKGGALDMVDQASKRERGNSFGAWRHVTPEQNKMIEAIIAAPIHVIATMRTKTDYVQDKDEKSGKTVVRKVGLAPVQRDGLEYEFDVVADLDQENNLIIGKTRCPQLAGRMFTRAGDDVAKILIDWLSNGTESAARAEAPLATADQVREILDLLSIVQLPDDTIDKWFAKAAVDTWEDMPAETIAKCIAYVKSRAPHSAQTDPPAPALPTAPKAAEQPSPASPSSPATLATSKIPNAFDMKLADVPAAWPARLVIAYDLGKAHRNWEEKTTDDVLVRWARLLSRKKPEDVTREGWLRMYRALQVGALQEDGSIRRQADQPEPNASQAPQKDLSLATV